MRPDRYDAVVAGAGPAGAVTALVLARRGAKVLLADPGRFPRDKACGDIVGPRGVALLRALDVLPGDAALAGDVVLVGPTWRGVRLPWPVGPGDAAGALVVRRKGLDDLLRAAALSAGAEARTARVDGVAEDDRGVDVGLSDGGRARASFLVGADGALSRTAGATGLLQPERALWGFALRSYVPGVVAAPLIVLWAPSGRRPIPGYGWAFPAGPGEVNVGLGVGVLGSRRRAALAGRLLPWFVRALADRGLLSRSTELGARRGGWLRMGLSGCTPAAGRVLLVGDAAGLVNPLQGEGISEAVRSGQAAAHAILDRPATAAGTYRAAIAHLFGDFQATAGAAQASLLARPRLRALTASALTAPTIASLTAPGLAIWWNDLVDPGAHVTGSRRARALGAAVGVATMRDRRRVAVRESLTAGPSAEARYAGADLDTGELNV